MAELRETIRVEIEVTPDQLKQIDQAVRDGQFLSRAEAVEHALIAWQSANSTMPFSSEDLGRLWDEGLASGDPLPSDDVFQRLREKFSKCLKDNEKNYSA